MCVCGRLPPLPYLRRTSSYAPVSSCPHAFSQPIVSTNKPDFGKRIYCANCLVDIKHLQKRFPPAAAAPAPAPTAPSHQSKKTHPIFGPHGVSRF